MTVDIRPLPAFEYAAPASLAEALSLLDAHGAAAKVLSGGTDLLPRMKKQKASPRIVIDINRIADLSFIAVRGKALHIGAATRLADLYDSPVVRDIAPALADAIHLMSSPGIRNRATIGGNLCNASRCADTPAPLLVHEALIKLSSLNGERVVPISAFFTERGHGCDKTVLRADEVMTEIVVPPHAGKSAFVKLGRRRGSSTAIVSVAALVATADGLFKDVRIAVGAFGSAPIRSQRVESCLRGAPIDEKTIGQASARIKDEIDAISDHRASAAYRREMAAVLIKRAVTQLVIGEA